MYYPLYERQIVWWAVQDLNLHSTNYEFAALTIKLTARNGATSQNRTGKPFGGRF